MATPANVSSPPTAPDGLRVFERARALLVVQYGGDREKEVVFEIELKDAPRAPFDYTEQAFALRELVAALAAWQAEGGQIYATRRAPE